MTMPYNDTPDGVPIVEGFTVTRSGPPHGHWLAIDELQKQHEYFWTTFAHGHWVLTDPDAIREAFQDSTLFSSSAEVATEPNPRYTFIPTNIDPPEHVKYRQILNPTFSPGAVGRLTPEATRLCDELIAGFRDAGRCEFIADFAGLYPTMVFLTALGLPLEDSDRVSSDVAAIFANLRDPARADELGRALMSIRAYFTEALEERRAGPSARTDFLTGLMAATKDGEPLSDDEILNICQVLAQAGLETTTGQLSYMFHHLATHPELRQRIVDDPSVIPDAVEEFLRIHSIVLPGRKVTRDVEFHGCPMRAGDMVMLAIPAANRCPTAIDRPLDVDFDRGTNRHVSFGSGPHRCLGIHLARRELCLVLEQWHKAIPSYRLSDGAELIERGGMLGLQSLPLEWD